MIAKKINPKLKKAIAKFGFDVEYYQENLNEFGEPVGEQLVVYFRGLYSESSTSATKQVKDVGSSVSENQCSLICLIDDTTKTVESGNILRIKTIPYEVIKVNNENLLDSYYNITIKKVK